MRTPTKVEGGASHGLLLRFAQSVGPGELQAFLESVDAVRRTTSIKLYNAPMDPFYHVLATDTDPRPTPPHDSSPEPSHAPHQDPTRSSRFVDPHR